MPIHVTVSTVQSLSNKTFVDRLSTTNVVFASSGNSDNWSSAYTTVQANSSTWGTSSGGADAQVRALTGNWQSTYTTVQANSSTWGAGGGTAAIGITVDGSGYAITTGDKGSIFIPYNATINSVTMIADVSGNCVVDILKSSYSTYPTASSICSTSLPTISGSFKSTDSSLVGWDTNIQSGNVLDFQVLSADSITKLTLTMGVTKY